MNSKSNYSSPFTGEGFCRRAKCRAQKRKERVCPIVLGKYSPSQNGVVVSPKGIALCIAGGGKGHDTDKPKILIEYD